ncbi:MAG: GTPase RsgA, partial [Ottowia sp.]
AATGEISQALGSGRHTTTATTWYWLDAARQSALIDSPGFQEFGLHHIAPADLPALMPDIAAHTGHCRFYNCTHQHEPGCGVRQAVAADEAADAPAEATPAPIDPGRWRIYTELHAELSRPQAY